MNTSGALGKQQNSSGKLRKVLLGQLCDFSEGCLCNCLESFVCIWIYKLLGFFCRNLHWSVSHMQYMV